MDLALHYRLSHNGDFTLAPENVPAGMTRQTVSAAWMKRAFFRQWHYAKMHVFFRGKKYADLGRHHRRQYQRIPAYAIGSMEKHKDNASHGHTLGGGKAIPELWRVLRLQLRRYVGFASAAEVVKYDGNGLPTAFTKAIGKEGFSKVMSRFSYAVKDAVKEYSSLGGNDDLFFIGHFPKTYLQTGLAAELLTGGAGIRQVRGVAPARDYHCRECGKHIDNCDCPLRQAAKDGKGFIAPDIRARLQQFPNAPDVICPSCVMPPLFCECKQKRENKNQMTLSPLDEFLRRGE